MIKQNSLEATDYLLTSEIIKPYKIKIDLFISFLEYEKLIYTYNNVLRLSQEAIKLGATYRITEYSKNVVWPKNSLTNFIEKFQIIQKNKEVETLENHGIEFIYHMTHIDNLPPILKNGLYPNGNQLQKKDISDYDVNSRRSKLEPVFFKKIHNYVPFYFNPKNAMLYVRRNIQNNIVILKLRKELLLQKNILFTDGNASCDNTKFFNNLTDLDKLNWQCINDNTWFNHEDGKRIKMSEVLIPDYVSVDNIAGIICNNTLAKLEIEKLESNIEIYLDNTNKFYF